MNKIIVFGFLGALPSKNNIDNWNHWKEFFTTNSSKKSNIQILLHPFLHDRESNNIQRNEFNEIFQLKDNINIVDENNHILTEWGTNSLADATLLMLQDSLLKFRSNLKKFILLSPSCCPIYSLDYIYNEVISDNKSWISGNDLTKLYKKNEPTNFKFFKDDNYVDSNGVKFSLYFSNWMIFDIKHINYFFLDATIQNYAVSTYIKADEEPYKCKLGKLNQRIIINSNFSDDENYTKLNDLKTFFSKPYLSDEDPLYNGINKNYCWPIEEIIFGNWILKQIIDNNNNILDELKYVTVDNIKNQLNTNKIFLKNLNLRYRTIKSKNFKKIKSTRNNDVGENSKIINSLEIPFGTEYPYLNNKNIRLISPTFTDWTQVSLDPHNILRKFRMKEINFQPINTKKTINEVVNDISKLNWNNFNINEFLNTENPNSSLQQLIDADEQLKEKNVKKLINNEMAMTRSLTVLPLLPSTWHPLEYSSWSLKNMVNAFILMNYFKKVFIDNKYIVKEIFNFREAYELYRTEIIKQNISIRKMIYDDVLIEVPILKPSNLNDPEFMEMYNRLSYGTIINPIKLITARVSGNLFIRKCNNGSKINIYSDILFENPNTFIKKTIGTIISKELKNYGISVKNFKEIQNILTKVRNLNVEDDTEANKSILNKFIMNHLSLSKKFIMDNGEEYIRFTLPKDIIVKIKNEIGRGAWNKATLVSIISGNNKLAVGSDVVLRTMFNNQDYPARNNAFTTLLSFFDNLVGVILSILQDKIFNYKICNNVYFISYDISTKIYQKPDYINDPTYVSAITEKIDGDTLGYLKNNFNYSTFLKIFYKIICKLDLLQDKLKFMHGDLKLDNVFYKYKEDGDIEVLLSDFGNSVLTIDGIKIQGNPLFVVKGMEEETPYYGKDILYFMINALREIKSFENLENNNLELKVLDLLKYLFGVTTYSEIPEYDKFIFLSRPKYKPSNIFAIDQRYLELDAKNVKKKLLEKYGSRKIYENIFKCNNIEISNNTKYYKKYFINYLSDHQSDIAKPIDYDKNRNYTYFSKYYKYKNKYLNLKKFKYK